MDALTTLHIIIVLIGLGLFALGLTPVIYRFRCPSCRRWFSLRTTGNERKEKRKGWIFTHDVEFIETRCRNCGLEKWLIKDDGSGGGGAG